MLLVLTEDIERYIAKNHEKSCTQLQREISERFNKVINPTTIRSSKRRQGCLSDLKSIRQKQVDYIRNHFKIYDDKTLAENLTLKYGRAITHHVVKKIRGQFKFYRGPKTGWTVKEVRTCPYCGNSIKITHKNPNQKFCSRDCASTWHRLNTYKKYRQVATDSQAKKFLKDWDGFVNKVIKDNCKGLVANCQDDIYEDYLYAIPSLIWGLSLKEEPSNAYKRCYIAKAIRHLIIKKYRELKTQNDNQVSYEHFAWKIS